VLELLTAVTAINSPPSGATAGVSLRGRQPGRAIKFRWHNWPNGVVLVKSTAGSGTMTVTVKMWGYNADAAKWYPLGSSTTEADRGKLNNQSTIDEDVSDELVHAEPISGLRAFNRIYAEITAIGGTATAVTVQLVKAENEIR
jgi:hypothetical protein